ncbi:MAG: hypothetical protein ABEJ68_01500 [Halobacteriaceae archaeon]
MGTTPEITNRTAFEEDSLALQVLLTVVTLTLYTVYWWHKVHVQLARGTSADFSPAWRTVGLFIPLYNFVVMWRTSHDASAVTGKDGILVFLLFMVFPPAGWFVVQTGINEAARGVTDAGDEMTDLS